MNIVQSAECKVESAVPEVSALNYTPLLNREAVHQFALEFAARTRAQKFERVSRSFLERINNHVRLAVMREVKMHPSKGKTLL